MSEFKSDLLIQGFGFEEKYTAHSRLVKYVSELHCFRKVDNLIIASSLSYSNTGKVYPIQYTSEQRTITGNVLTNVKINLYTISTDKPNKKRQYYIVMKETRLRKNMSLSVCGCTCRRAFALFSLTFLVN